MDWEYVGKLLLSVLIFAPGLILLAMALLIGFLMILEKVGLFGARKRREEAAGTADALSAQAVNPPAGRIVSELKRTLEEVEGEEEKRGRTAS